MKSKPVAFLMADLGVTNSHSRPYVSADNPYSESQFRTMKYRPDFPDRFGCIQDSRAFCKQFFQWYTKSTATPASPYLPRPRCISARPRLSWPAARWCADNTYQEHPDRFVRRPPKPISLLSEVWINKPAPSVEKTEEGSQ